MSHEILSLLMIFVMAVLGYLARQQRYLVHRLHDCEKDLEDCRKRIIRAFPADTD